MTAFFSNYLLNFLVGWYFGSRSRTVPTTMYAALMTTSGSDANGTGAVEATGYSYARVAITNNTTNWPDPTAGVTSNGAIIRWPKADGGNHGEIQGVYIYDAATSGNLLWGVNIPSGERKTMNDGETVEYEIGDLTAGLANPTS